MNTLAKVRRTTVTAERASIIYSKKDMSLSRGLNYFLVTFLLLGSAVCASAQKDPVIIIPGLQGSELLDTHGKHVWFSIHRGKPDDIRLPINSPLLARNRDTIKVGDIIRKVDIKFLPDVEVYQAVIDALTEKGYTEATWSNPRAENVFYVFPYDWRRDNVESAQLLMRRMAAVRKALRRPNLKFDILAHSMGGLIARYAAMYGSADLPAEGATPTPTWAGASYIGKLMMFGTPNEGSMSAFQALQDGSPIVLGRKLPFIDDFRNEDVFACPSVYQLLPHRGQMKFLDENLQPVDVDLYDARNWEKYGWGAIADAKFLSKLKDAATLAKTNKDIKPKSLDKDANLDDRLTSQTTFAQARLYLATVLKRAKRFHAALDATSAKVPVELFAYGGNCAQTLDGAVLVQDNDGEWSTILDGKDIKSKDGKETKKDAVKLAIFSLGDGRVTQRSLLAATETAVDGKPQLSNELFPLTSSFFACGSHTKLFLEKPIQDSFLSALVVEKKDQP